MLSSVTAPELQHSSKEPKSGELVAKRVIHTVKLPSSIPHNAKAAPADRQCSSLSRCIAALFPRRAASDLAKKQLYPTGPQWSGSSAKGKSRLFQLKGLGHVQAAEVKGPGHVQATALQGLWPCTG
eukprot:1158310-Pelagomonas_calceolata.AAC.11